MTSRRALIMATWLGVLAFAATPPARAASIQNGLEKKLSEVLHEPVRIRTYDINFAKAQAVLHDLTVGEASPDAAGQPLATIKTLTVDLDAGSLLTGQTRFKKMFFRGVHFHVGTNATGESNLQRFLAKMFDGGGEGVPPIDHIDFAEVSMTFYAPDKLTAPQGRLKPGPVHVHFDELTLRDLSNPRPAPPAPAAIMATPSNHKPNLLPAPTGPDARPQAKPAPPQPAQEWTEIRYKKMRIRAPYAHGVDGPAAQMRRLPAIAEGLEADAGRFELHWQREPQRVLKVRGVTIQGLKGRSYLARPGETETFLRIWNTLRSGLLGLSIKADPAKPLDPRKLGSLWLRDLEAKDAQIEIAGPAADGRLAYWRLLKLHLIAEKVAFGPHGWTPAKDGDEGRMRLVADTASSEGAGTLRLGAAQLTGTWPESSFLFYLNVSNLALPAVSTRLGNDEQAGFVRGQAALRFKGGCSEGVLDLDGTVTVSPETKLADARNSKDRSRKLTKIANGKPLDGFHVRGTLEEPTLITPDVVAVAMKSFFTETIPNGARAVKENVLEKIPVLGRLFE